MYILLRCNVECIVLSFLEVVKVLEKFYDTFVDENNIETEYNIPAEHSIVGEIHTLNLIIKLL